MSEWKAKRFWRDTEAVAQSGGYGVLLDGRPVRTPAKAPLVVPTMPLADAIAAEWDAQEGTIDPLSMPTTRSANSALDKVAAQRDEVAAMLAAYAETDLLCHRADDPEALALLQSEAWDPLLEWSAAVLQAPLTSVSGIMAEPQAPESLARIHERVAAQDDFALTALHDLIALSGSVVIGLAVIDAFLPVEELWRRSRIDETWQESQWGVDEEAAAHAALKRDAFLHAARFYALSRPA